MRFNLRAVVPQDLDLLEAKDCFDVGELHCTRELIDLSRKVPGGDSICLGFCEGDTLLGVAGSYRSWAGSAQAWAVFDNKVDTHPLALTKTCLSLINYAFKEQELRRLSLTVRSGYTKGIRFAEALGFTLEGHMRRYMPNGGDANLYSRLF